MLNSFKEFWRSYFEVCKISGKWMRKHWIGCIIFYIVYFFGFMVWLYREDIMWNLKHLKKKKTIEGMDEEEFEKYLKHEFHLD